MKPAPNIPDWIETGFLANPAIDRDDLRRRFEEAKPFGHLVIENFLLREVAEQLLQQFPVFDPERAKNEHGHVGGKATCETVRNLGSAYELLDDAISSPAFLRYLEDITGIRDLRYDPSYFGGGTHENRHGQELDPHIDFNYDSARGLHRRLNLLVYLNHEWRQEWGGGIELHSNPRDWATNECVEFLPLFNRCVLFETNEHSWHGFERINLPADKQHLSRKSLSLYFYSPHPPRGGAAAPHATFYVQRWLPKTIRAGRVLNEQEYNAIERLLRTRDAWIAHYQRRELETSTEQAHLQRAFFEARYKASPQIFGYVRKTGDFVGWHPDGWVEERAVLPVAAERPVRAFRMAMNPPEAISAQALTLRVMRMKPGGGWETLEEVKTDLPQGRSVVECVLRTPLSGGFEIRFEFGAHWAPSASGASEDRRKLAAFLGDIVFEH